MSDSRIVRLARMRIGSGVYAVAGSMADDLGRLAAGVIVLDAYVRRLWAVAEAATRATYAECTFDGTRCGFGQHSDECAINQARNAFLAALEECPVSAIKAHVEYDVTEPSGATHCTQDCEATQQCVVCHRRKAPRGRSVAHEMATSLCCSDCDGYYAEPKPGHLWPGEAIR